MNVPHSAIFLTCCALCSVFAGDTNTNTSGFRFSGLAILNRVQPTGIRLISTKEDLLRNLDTAEVGVFDRQIADAIDKAIGGTNDQFELVIQVRLAKDKKPSFQMVSKGNVSKKTLRKVSGSLRRLPDFRSRRDDFRYELQFTILRRP
jgi:hypothetical protein